MVSIFEDNEKIVVSCKVKIPNAEEILEEGLMLARKRSAKKISQYMKVLVRN